MSTYKLIEGLRKGSQLCVSNSYLYVKDMDKNNHRYMKCAEFRKGCPGRASLNLETGEFSDTTAHDRHQVTDEHVEILQLKTSLKRKAENSERTLREIFDEETNKSDFGGYVSFIDMENSMYKRRRLNRPTVPQDAEEAITLLNDCSDEFRTYLIFSINEPANRKIVVGFMSPKWLTALRFDSETLLQADATFYVVAKQFYQLLNIFLHYKSYTLPAFHILMSCKSRALYDKIVVKIKTILSFTVSDIITDFEEALFQSFSSGFPEADGSGCLFHFKKATYQTGILKNGLANVYSGEK